MKTTKTVLGIVVMGLSISIMLKLIPIPNEYAVGMLFLAYSFELFASVLS